jgi:cytochrome c peroxidase
MFEHVKTKKHAVAIARAGAAVFIAVAIGSSSQLDSSRLKLPNLFPFRNEKGIAQTFNASGNGEIDFSGPFFQSLGTNGRSCFSCHQPDQGWTVAPRSIAHRFRLTEGRDPIFRTVDGANCDHDVDTSSVDGRRKAYSLLVEKGLFRVAIPVPPDAEYEVIGVNNPYGCNDLSIVSTYRRPLPSTNLKFLSTLMWDGRESTPPATQKINNPDDLIADLGHQATDAVAGHEEADVPLSPENRQQIVDFELGLFTAQAIDFGAGSLDAGGATGGPKALANQNFFIGINDPLGQNPTGAPFSPVIFDPFNSWENSHNRGRDGRGSVARGQALFNTRAINITGVAGLNDVTGLTVIPGNCGTCHDSPNVGNHSVAVPLNIGVSNPDNSLGVGYLPVVTLRNVTTKEVVETTDPGRALITGKWADVGKVKGPVLRALAARAPYFHNGSAQTLDDVVDFYNDRFAIGFTAQEKADLVAFLSAL